MNDETLETRNVKASHSEYRIVKNTYFYFFFLLHCRKNEYTYKNFFNDSVLKNTSHLQKYNFSSKLFFLFYFNMKVVV